MMNGTERPTLTTAPSSAVRERLLEDLPAAGDQQQHAEQQAERKRDRHRDADHHERLARGLPDQRDPVLVHASPPTSSARVTSRPPIRSVERASTRAPVAAIRSSASSPSSTTSRASLDLDAAEAGEQAGGQPRAGARDDLAQRAGLDDAAGVEQRDRVAHAAHDVHLVRDQQDGQPELGVDAPQQLEHRVRGLGVQRGGRLVGQQHRRLGGQRAGDPDALLLAAGELRGVGAGAVREPDEVEQLERAPAPLGPARARDLQRQRDVLERGPRAQQVELLEDHPDLAGAWRAAAAPRIRVTSSPAMRMLPAVGSSSRLTQRISVLLPVPRTPDDAEDLALGDVEIDAVEGDDTVGKDLAQAADLDRHAVRSIETHEPRSGLRLIMAPISVSGVRPTVTWADGAIEIIDQTLLPAEERVLRLTTPDEVVDAIQRLAVRGAPAIGVTGRARRAAVRGRLRRRSGSRRRGRPRSTCAGASSACWRPPTGPPRRWRSWPRTSPRAARSASTGAPSSRRASRFLTVCNAGRLATAGMGTALAPIYAKAEAGEAVEVFACETRPLLQGARLTAWELADAGIPVTVLPDGAAPALLAGGGIDAVIVGCDRVAANGDVANKIGTYALAIAARHHGVPFYVAGPRSTLDAATATGAADRDRAARRGRGARGRRPRRDDRGLEPCLRRDPRRAHHRPDHRRGRAARAVRARDRGSPLRAAVYLAGGEVRIEERPVPRPGPGEVLVAMRACGICGSDLMDWYTAHEGPDRARARARGRGRRVAGSRAARARHARLRPSPRALRRLRLLPPRPRDALRAVQGDPDRAGRLLRVHPRARAERRARPAAAARPRQRRGRDADRAAGLRRARPRPRAGGRRDAPARHRRRPDGPADRAGRARARRRT